MKNWFKDITPYALCLVIAGAGLSLVLGSFQKSPSDGHTAATNTQAKRNIIKFNQQNDRSPAQTQTKTPNHPKEIHWKKASNPVTRLERLSQCYQTEGACGFPTTDPKAEHFAIGKALSQQLLEIQQQAMLKQERSSELSKIAREYLKNPDGHVKEAALHLLSTQETSTENLSSLIDNVIQYHDANLIQQAMLEMTRYKDNTDQEQIDQALIAALKTGSPLVSEEIAKNLGFIINENNYEIYRKALGELSIGSVAYQNLKNLLDDFKRQQNAA